MVVPPDPGLTIACGKREMPTKNAPKSLSRTVMRMYHE